MSTLARVGLTIGALIGLAPLLGTDTGDYTSETVGFLALTVAFAVIPYLVFVRVERTWRRPPAIALLALLATAHVAITVQILATLDEDALNGVGFLTVPPLLAAAVGIVGIVVALTRAVAARRHR